MKRKIGLVAVLALAVCGVAFWLASRMQLAVPPRGGGVETASGAETAADVSAADVTAADGDGTPQAGEGTTAEDASTDAPDGEPEAEEPKSEEELRAEAEERQVNAFDELTDKWMEPSEKGVTMKDIETFCERFRQVPKARKDECVHRALNLVPDENVMLLAGILMDKTQDKEIVETVYNDILNRDEDVKKPILLQIFKDKTHPCWADTAWILDVTDELPGKKKTE